MSAFRGIIRDALVVAIAATISVIALYFLSAVITDTRADEAVLLEKEKPAPYTGVLMPVEKVQELRKSSLELETEKQRSASLTRSVELLKESEKLKQDSINAIEEQNAKLAKTVAKGQGLQEFELLFAAGGGILLTGNIPVGLGVMGGGLVVWIVKLITTATQN
jgi:hypothetical protein